MDGVRVEQGGVSDYDALAEQHYRAGRPAVAARGGTLRAVACGRTVGVLVVSMPVLNGAWRSAAWPCWLEGLTKRERAEALNAQLRTIARVVVAPPFRGRGVGSLLVRAYLAAPLTPLTEALAAMGAVCPVFERAGMRRVGFAASRAGGEVARSVRACGVPVWALADASVRRRLARDAGVARALRRLAADRWRAGSAAPAHEQMERLWVCVASRPVVYAAGAVIEGTLAKKGDEHGEAERTGRSEGGACEASGGGGGRGRGGGRTGGGSGHG